MADIQESHYSAEAHEPAAGADTGGGSSSNDSQGDSSGGDPCDAGSGEQN